MANVLNLMDDSDDDLMLDHAFKDIEPFKGSNDVIKHDCIMCCCKKDMPHNESMKFQLKVAEHLDPQFKDQLLNTPIF